MRESVLTGLSHLSRRILPDFVFGYASDVPQGSPRLDLSPSARLISVEKKRGFRRGISLRGAFKVEHRTCEGEAMGMWS